MSPGSFFPGHVKQLVEHHVDDDAWFRQQVIRGLEQLDKGEFLTHEEVGARLEGRLTQARTRP